MIFAGQGLDSHFSTALKECAVSMPVLVPGNSTALPGMVSKLNGIAVPEALAKEFAKSLMLAGNDLGDPVPTDLGAIAQVWRFKNPNQYTPEFLIEALVCTKGLGRFASNIACKFICMYVYLLIVPLKQIKGTARFLHY